MKGYNVSENAIKIERYLRKIDHIVRLKGREILGDLNITIPQFTALHSKMEGLTEDQMVSLSKGLERLYNAIKDNWLFILDKGEEGSLQWN